MGIPFLEMCSEKTMEILGHTFCASTLQISLPCLINQLLYFCKWIKNINGILNSPWKRRRLKQFLMENADVNTKGI